MDRSLIHEIKGWPRNQEFGGLLKKIKLGATNIILNALEQFSIYWNHIIDFQWVNILIPITNDKN